MESEVWSVKCGVWSVIWEVRSVVWEVWSVGCFSKQFVCC